MSDNTTGSTLLSHPLIYVEDPAQVVEIVKKLGIGPHYVIMDKSPPTMSQEDLRNAFPLGAKYEHLRLRATGVWNSVMRAMGRIEDLRYSGKFTNASELYFITFHSFDVIAQALTRHREVANITSDEQMMLGIVLKDNALECVVDDVVDTMLTLPVVATTRLYKSLSVHEKLALTGFEFSRFTRPVANKTLTQLAGGKTPFLARRVDA